MSELAHKRLERAANKRLKEVQDLARKIRDVKEAEIYAEAAATAKHAFNEYWLGAIEAALAKGEKSVSNKHMYGIFFGRSVRPRIDQPYIGALKELLGEPFVFTVKEYGGHWGFVRYKYLEVSWGA